MDFNNSGSMRSPFSPRVRQSISGRRAIGLSSAKKNQSKFTQSSNEQAGDVIYKTPLVTVETHGLPLPVMVTEVLTLGSGEVSVRMSECGWCWVVCGRRILAWPHSLPDDGNTSISSGGLAARELTLPQTDLAHKADLVVVFYSEGSQMASCVGVSPEGVVRYWPSVGQEGVHWDVSCELAGQECDRLVMASGALILATTTCTLVLIEPATIEGRQTVSCRRLCPGSGWLGGIGRRVSLMFFGSMPAHAETKLVGVVGVGGSRAEPHLALVAGGGVLQLWRGAELHEHGSLLDSCLHGEGVNGREVAVLDVRAQTTTSLLLLVGIGATHTNRRYAIVHINIKNPARPVARTAGVVRGFAGATAAAGAGPGLGAEGGEEPRFLPLGSRVLFYTSKCMALASLSTSNEGVELICVDGEMERILGAELSRGQALLFSRKHGVLLLTCKDTRRPPPSACESPLGSPCASDMYDGNLSLFEIDPHEISMVTTDACGKLKTAFLFHLRRESTPCRVLLGDLFPPRDEDGDVDGVLARTVLAVAKEMLDDVPAGDPRWKARPGLATNIPLGSSAALQVSAQLADKRRAFALYADFLRTTGLMQRAGAVTAEGGVVVRCESALCQLAERLAAASALREAQDSGPPLQPLVEFAIELVIGNGSEEEDSVAEALAHGALFAEDACYRRVTRVLRVLCAVARASPPAAPLAAAHAAYHSATLLTNVISVMQKTRVAWGSERAPPQLGPRALLPALIDFINRSLNEVARACPNPTLRAQVTESCASLARAVLHEVAPLQRVSGAEDEYRRMRRELILAFVEEDGSGSSRAISLADSFRDFELLVQLCVEHADMHTLQEYIDKYEHEGMAEIAYCWLAQRGGKHAAEVARGGAGGARLGAWLLASSERAPLAALHALGSHRPRAAAALLADMAAADKDCLDRATTAASLGKLCVLASSGDEVSPEEEHALRARLEAVLALGEHQRAAFERLRARTPHDTQAVLDAEDLVQMYIESEDESLTEYDYKKALDLTDFIEDMERRDDLRLRVWCACIRRESWSEAGAARDQLRDKMFFRLIDLVHLMGGDLELLLPPLEDILTAPELAELAGSPSFHYLLKYGYQCLHTQQH